MYYTSSKFVRMARGVCLLLLSIQHVYAVSVGRDVDVSPTATTALTVGKSTMSPRIGRDECPSLDTFLSDLSLDQLYETLDLVYRRIDAFSNVTSGESIFIRAIVSSPHPRHVRSVSSFRTLLRSVSTFVVRSGVVQAFKVSCATFLKTAGRLLLGEFQQQFFKKFSRSDFNVTPSRLRRAIPIPSIDDADIADGSFPCVCENSAPYVSKLGLSSIYYTRNFAEYSLPHVSLKGNLWYITDLHFHPNNYYWTHGDKQPLVPGRAYKGYPHGLEKYMSQDFDRIFDGNKCLLETLVCFIPFTSRPRAISPNIFGCGESLFIQLNLGGLFFPIKNTRGYEVCKGITGPRRLVNEEPKPFMKSTEIHDLFLNIKNLLGEDGSSLRFVDFHPQIRVDFSSY